MWEVGTFSIPKMSKMKRPRSRAAWADALARAVGGSGPSPGQRMAAKPSFQAYRFSCAGPISTPYQYIPSTPSWPCRNCSELAHGASSFWGVVPIF